MLAPLLPLVPHRRLHEDVAGDRDVRFDNDQDRLDGNNLNIAKKLNKKSRKFFLIEMFPPSNGVISAGT